MSRADAILAALIAEVERRREEIDKGRVRGVTVEVRISTAGVRARPAKLWARKILAAHGGVGVEFAIK